MPPSTSVTNPCFWPSSWLTFQTGNMRTRRFTDRFWSSAAGSRSQKCPNRSITLHSWVPCPPATLSPSP
ncbi:hypothetical protein COCC4DRAFT_29792 [Bipolaris maydis ATCC 48331]|uniref:Uncharacterized protein n=2 Tax=Cochliobolus heterostrophus TaxID=5016 RepID=M2TTM4_COCH5|nr:uncharacterized protein COCC4DRAFT_29792 [Bipolaris maydis ATCC 48331]EMD89849.1 hypothetical protein COCHEDRAFT_1022050 [Bipolaris maydis C5]ENI09938.1 hypothetical protein COCC4DRAFT_29792 [Bipolaris maydis ATCC 48331]